MRIVQTIALAVVFAPAIVAAQTTTVDGVKAVLRGDYEAAAKILKPLAEDTAQPDPIAQFFLASLYHSGRGVARNELRACSLYASAASVTSTLAPWVYEIAQAVAEPYAAAPPEAALCVPANTLPWADAPPASFALGAGHWVRIEAGSTTIGFEGAEHRTLASRSGPGSVYLPFQYAPVDVSSPVVMRRHFVQSFFWHRNSGPTGQPTWSLAWFLEEVVGGDIFFVTSDPRLIAVTAAQPPASIDTSRLVAVRVNARGEAEWNISDPANPRGGIIALKGGR
jgi:hypothetical protein